MGKPMTNIGFRGMSLVLKVRDLFSPRGKVLEEVGIEPGSTALDYACGPGSYVVDTAELVGQSGKVFALDSQPLAVRKVKRLALKKQLENVEAIQSDCATGLPDGSVDIVLLYDAFHLLDNPDMILEELHRVLKQGGVLSFSDHHMKEDDVAPAVTSGGLFRFSGKGKKTYSFISEG